MQDELQEGKIGINDSMLFTVASHPYTVPAAQYAMSKCFTERGINE